VIIAGSDRRRHRLQARRRSRRREPLRRAHVRRAVGADVAVGPALARGPLDRVVAVARFVGKAIPHTRRGEPPAAILHHHVVTGFGGAQSVERAGEHSGHRLVVGRAVEEHGQLVGSVGAEEISAQHASVAHGHFDISLDDNSGHHETSQRSCQLDLLAKRLGFILI